MPQFLSDNCRCCASGFQNVERIFELLFTVKQTALHTLKTNIGLQRELHTIGEEIANLADNF